ncbi:hypothetical protein KEC37_02035 [Candidatus Schneideria nysicola]|uniref:DNA polymerase III subunit delta' C-terminal domain-containing protein n=1 Tax=Candidatus Schneideria nysicola TaxID=1081631 RepID=UPI001CAA6F9A|nr:DNA polymerase III subunit delta' C-terminal domain-containing protein [Candidatus Schneideria nysicola]UAJ65398.1 hypothetical protein KEC37_02035 [Candidatus Schneideria nysicola]
MNQYPWLNTYYNRIIQYYHSIKEKNNSPSPLLLISQEGNGANYLLYNIIIWLMCPKSYKEKFCGLCNHCQLMKARTHPDCYQINCKKENIGIDNIRSTLNNLYKYAHQGKKKIIWLQYIEFLNIHAINVLLKIMEDPPNNTCFFIECEKIYILPLTLRSRCHRWILPTPNENFILNWLKKNNNLTDCKIALRLCNGTPIHAQKLLSIYWEDRSKFCLILSQSVQSNDFLKLFPFILKEDKSIRIKLSWLYHFLWDALKYKKYLFDDISNIDQFELIKILSNRWNTFFFYKHLNNILILIKRFEEGSRINHELGLINQLIALESNI